MGNVYLVTGAAGFIGFHVARRLLAEGHEVIGLDNLNSYYDPALKHARLAQLKENEEFTMHVADLADRAAMAGIFAEEKPEIVIHLAAQAGVRYSLENPAAYIDSNLVGFGNVLEGCRHSGVKHLVYASSSSVYGLNSKMPYSVEDNVDHPVSLYAATKKANELMAHSYSHLFKLPTTGLRFFTVYGPWGRPDMAYFSFTRKILAGEPIEVFNNGNMQRDCTYIDDIVEGVCRVAKVVPEGNVCWSPAEPDPASSPAPYRVFNIGNHQPVPLMRMIDVLEEHLGRKAERVMKPIQAGDVLATYADVEDLAAAIQFEPATSIEEGLGQFVKWYRDYASA